MQRHEVEALRLGVEAAGEPGSTRIAIGRAVVTYDQLIELCDEWVEAQDHECSHEGCECDMDHCEDHGACVCDCESCAKCEDKPQARRAV